MSSSTNGLSPRRFDQLLDALRDAAGREHVLHHPQDLLLYEYDGSVSRRMPDVVVLPETAEQIAVVVRIAGRYDLPIVARGSGTSLSGAAVPREGGIVVSTSRMNRILEMDFRDARAIVEPGVVNLNLTRAAMAGGFNYLPDPSSEKACSIGGNVALNAGGPHTIAWGVTTNHVTGLEFVTADGRIVRTGTLAPETSGYDLTGLLVGSEGTLGIVTRIAVRLVHLLESVRTMLVAFDTVDTASAAVSEIIARGIVPTSLELMDQICVRAISKWMPSANLPQDADAILIIEVEGVEDGLEQTAAEIAAICTDSGPLEVRRAATAAERDSLWAARKGTFGAIGVLAPNYYVQDGVVPRSRLPEVLRQVYEIGTKYGLEIANVFHAGDGNIHPLILFDDAEPGALERVHAAGTEILRVCIAAGGTLTGEHGLGMEKNEQLPELLDPADIAAMIAVRDVFSPARLFNPSKIFPLPLSARRPVAETAVAGPTA
ncbi:MAG: FAD-linked oxidase C-terminal domain-containing protein [Chloroflexota bacterium]|jgi:glycolate oxidase|nr:FAD-linked oxidase C-terminal domain-containing protein [Chloroflexota bacterium]MDP6508550.1 FAD-linked oxidase C-terminal domain-containing protein [Chloroflexota bacterium]MDP6756859.1 FAD-linked oxidase C-terminal domain-containing protein [Chloroflexota bacterium]